MMFMRYVATALLWVALVQQGRAYADELRSAGSEFAGKIIQRIAEKYSKENAPKMTTRHSGGSTSAGLRALCAGRVDLAITDRPLEKYDAAILSKGFPDQGAQPERFLLGLAAIIVVVPKESPARALTPSQVRDIFSQQGIVDWGQLGFPKAKIVRCVPVHPAPSAWFFRQRFIGHQRAGEDLRACGSDRRVIDQVAATPKSIGICLLPFAAEYDRVRAVAITVDKQGKRIFPTKDNVLSGTYPMLLKLELFIHPKARSTIRAFCRYAISDKSCEIIQEFGIMPAYEREKILIAKRLAAMKAGKGVPIRGVGSMGGAGVLRDMAVEYVKAKEVVQMACRPATSELTAVGYFVHGKDRELLVLDGPISEQAKKIHGKKWDFLEPQTHVLATGRGIAICVNSMNKLGSLTLEQVRHLFSKKTATWREVTGADVKVKRYGLAGTDPAARVFYNRINPPAACARAETRQGTQGVLAALSRDPHGIAFVDAAAANDLLAAAADKSGIKVLSIGAKGKAAAPTAANVKAGKYPIAQRLTLHVSPRASQTTRDFVEFVLSGAADEVFTKHGLITPAQARKAQRK